MRQLLCVVFAAAVAAGFARPAAAQDGSEPTGERTPDAARRFLTAFLPAQQAVALQDGWYGDSWNRAREASWMLAPERLSRGLPTTSRSSIGGQVLSVEYPEPCIARIGISEVQLWGVDFDSGNLRQSASYRLIQPRTPYAFELNLRDVISVSGASNVTITLSGDFFWTIAFPRSSPAQQAEQTNRIRFALESIRESCASNDGSGY